MNSNTESKLIELRCEADYFGFAYQLALHINLHTSPISLSSMQHGWNPFYPEFPERFFHSGEGLKLVADDRASSYLRSKGYNSYSVGLPFINYLQFGVLQNIRVADSVLITLRHSHPHYNYSLADNVQKIIDYYSPKSSKIGFLVPFSDLGVYQEILKKNPNVLVEFGADVRDVHSFPRLKKAFSKYEFLVSTSWGSQLIYGAACGMKVSISAPFFEPYQPSDFALNPWYVKYPFLVDGICRDASFQHIEKSFPDLLVDSFLPGISINHVYFKDYLKTTDPVLLSKLLGWSNQYGRFYCSSRHVVKKIIKKIVGY